MTRWGLIILIGWCAVACRKTEVQMPMERPAPPFSQPSTAPSPQVAQKIHRAPEGTFFLLQRVSITTNSGVIGFAPGTRVRMIESTGEMCRITDGTTTFDVLPTQLTDDVDLAALAARQDTESQKAVADYMQRQNEAYRQAREADKTWLDEQDQRVAARRQAAAQALAHRPNPLDRGSYNQTYSVPYWYYPYWHSYRYYYGHPMYVDQFSQRYWIDSSGQKHYLP